MSGINRGFRWKMMPEPYGNHMLLTQRAKDGKTRKQFGANYVFAVILIVKHSELLIDI